MLDVLTLITAVIRWFRLPVCLAVQVQTSRQRAINMVHGYPFIAHKDKIVGVLAEQHGEPSVTALLSDTTKSDMRHSADWQQVTQYLNSISMANMHMHQPLLSHLLS